MLLGMRRGLKSIDFYQAVPSQLTEGTISGACISLICIGLLSALILLAIMDFNNPRIGSDMIVDQKHLQEKLRVNIDISFPTYPCSILSLDVQNILKVHEVNIGPNIQKHYLPDNTTFVQIQGFDERLKRLLQDYEQNRGCRMSGWFQIDRVPGNFHFSCHGYADIFQALLNSGLAFSHKKLDMSHVIHQFWFGEKREQHAETLAHFSSKKQIGQQFLGISYTYFLDIIQNNVLDTVSNKSSEHYYYTVRMNEVILSAAPMVYFKYQTNSITVLTFMQYKQWHELFVKVVGIVGGIFTMSLIFDSIVHSSILFLMEKHRLNKLR